MDKLQAPWRTRSAPRSVESGRAIHRAVDIVDRSAELLPGEPGCLSRSLVVQWLLQRSGIESSLRIGVHREGLRLEAHAWIEVDHRPVNDSQAVVERFEAFTEPVTPQLLRAIR